MDSNHRRLSQRIYSPPPLATRASLDIKYRSDALAILPTACLLVIYSWSWRRDLNPRPSDYKSDALPTVLRQHVIGDQDEARTRDLQRDRLAF